MMSDSQHAVSSDQAILIEHSAVRAYFETNPRNKIVQPDFRRSRSPVRGPRDSETLNLEMNQMELSLRSLYRDYAVLDTELKTNKEALFNGGLSYAGFSLQGYNRAVEKLNELRDRLTTVSRFIDERAHFRFPRPLAPHTAWWASDLEYNDGDPVSLWVPTVDSFNASNLTQSDAAKRPLYDASLPALNSRPVVQADGNDLLTSSSFTLTEPYTVVLVASAVSADSVTFDSGNETIGTYHDGVSMKWFMERNVKSPVAAFQTDVIVFASFNGANSKLRVNGSVVTGNPMGVAASDVTVNLFADASGLNGDTGALAFFMIVEGELLAEEVNQIEEWAIDYYGLFNIDGEGAFAARSNTYDGGDAFTVMFNNTIDGSGA